MQIILQFLNTKLLENRFDEVSILVENLNRLRI